MRSEEFNQPTAIYLIRSGKILEAVKNYVKKVNEVSDAVNEFCKENGFVRYTKGDFYELVGVDYRYANSTDFSKPNKRGICHPKKGTEIEKMFKDLPRVDIKPRDVIREMFNVPYGLRYRSEKCTGSRSIGRFFDPAGFLWLSKEGPFAMWIPDVESELNYSKEKGETVEEPEASFSMKLKGCKRITEEEWEFLVAKNNLKKVKNV